MEDSKGLLRNLLKGVLGAFAVCAAAIVTIGVIIAIRTPTIQDVRASHLIYEEIVQSRTNILFSEQVRFISMPRRGSTKLIVIGDVSESQRRALRALAEQIQSKSGRAIKVVFQQGN